MLSLESSSKFYTINSGKALTLPEGQPFLACRHYSSEQQTLNGGSKRKRCVLEWLWIKMLQCVKFLPQTSCEFRYLNGRWNLGLGKHFSKLYFCKCNEGDKWVVKSLKVRVIKLLKTWIPFYNKCLYFSYWICVLIIKGIDLAKHEHESKSLQLAGLLTWWQSTKVWTTQIRCYCIRSMHLW